MRPGGVEIREPSPDEWELSRALRLRALQDSPLAFLDTYEAAIARPEEAWRERVAPSTSRAQVVAIADDGTWVGTMTVLFEPEPPLLVAVYVEPWHRGDGTASALLAGVVERARARGATRLRLQVSEGNDRARAFYERHGFVATGDVELYPGHPIPEHEMILELGA